MDETLIRDQGFKSEGHEDVRASGRFRVRAHFFQGILLKIEAAVGAGASRGAATGAAGEDWAAVGSTGPAWRTSAASGGVAGRPTEGTDAAAGETPRE